MLSSSEDEYVYGSTRRAVYWGTPNSQMRKKCQDNKIAEENSQTSNESGNEETVSTSSNGGNETKKRSQEFKESSHIYKEIGAIDDFSESGSSLNEKNEVSDECKKDQNRENCKSDNRITERAESTDNEDQNKDGEEIQEPDDLKWLKSFVHNQTGSNFWPPDRENDESWNSAEPPTKDLVENPKEDVDVDKKEGESNKGSEVCEDENRYHSQSSSDVDEGGSDFLKNRLEKLQIELSSMRKELLDTRLALEKERKEVEEQEKAVAQKNFFFSNGEGFLENSISLGRPYTAHTTFSELGSDAICRPLTVSNLNSFELESKRRNTRQDASAGYKVTLDSLERLMNDELSNIQDNIGKLEPLTKIAATWETEPIQERK